LRKVTKCYNGNNKFIAVDSTVYFKFTKF
jgi:hypothetical protein